MTIRCNNSESLVHLMNLNTKIMNNIYKKMQGPQMENALLQMKVAQI
jgi:hypothetical protein